MGASLISGCGWQAKSCLESLLHHVKALCGKAWKFISGCGRWCLKLAERLFGTFGQ
jgi:hypothetical protein